MKSAKDFLILLPTIGILIFVGFYFYSASLYPGGSQADVNSMGFEFGKNLWCNLMSEPALNGQQNLARPSAITGMIILCSSMTLFFFLFAGHFVKNQTWKLIIKISGALAMLAAVFVFTGYHDVMTTILSVGGVLVIIGIIRTLHKEKMTFFMLSGIACMLVVGINNWFYYDENFNDFLPVVQKFTFLFVLAWTIGLNLKMKDKNLLQQFNQAK